jgi:type IV pilus assembly protein PilE
MQIPPNPARRQGGFTIVELLIAVVIVGVLAAVALPSFFNQIRKGRRSEAFAALAAVQQAQEKWRSSNPQYATNTQLTAAPPDGLGLTSGTPTGYYTVVLGSTSDTAYTATATAVSGTSQGNDDGCQVLSVRMQGGNLSYGSGSSSADYADPKRCWAR